MARTTKKTSKKTSRKMSKEQPKKKSVFHKILTAEGWRRLMMGRTSKKTAKKK